MEHVSSRQNAVVKRFRDLAREGRLGDDVLIDGAHLVTEALEAGVELDLVAFTADVAGQRLAALAARCGVAQARVVTVPATLLAVMSPVRQPSGVIAIGRLRPATLSDALETPRQLVVLLDRVQDPGNVGAIVRAAEACGGTGIITGPGTADPFGWKSLRGSMGSAFRLPIASVESLAVAIDAARAAGIRIFATAPRGGTPLRQAALDGAAAILIGGEGSGLSSEMIGGADESLSIEMRPPVESLNLSVAAALILYEASRQRADVAV